MCVWTQERQAFLRVVLGKQKNNNKDRDGSGKSIFPGRGGMWSRGSRRERCPGHGASGRSREGSGWQPQTAVQSIPSGASDAPRGCSPDTQSLSLSLPAC